jgi:hypothetical protein
VAKPRPVFNSRNQRLQNILHKGKAIHHLNIKVQTLLPDDLAEHIQVANWRLGILVLVADNAAWATRFRYYMPQLRQQLRHPDYLPDLKKIDIKVASYQKPPATYDTVSRPQMSKTTRQQWEQTLKHCDDPELRKAIEKMVRKCEDPE